MTISLGSTTVLHIYLYIGTLTLLIDISDILFIMKLCMLCSYCSFPFYHIIWILYFDLVWYVKAIQVVTQGCVLTLLILFLKCYFRFLTNSYLREEAPSSYAVEQRVEWQVLMFPSFILTCSPPFLGSELLIWGYFHGPVSNLLILFCRLYAFDVHCNSFFPVFVLLYGNFLIHARWIPKLQPNLHVLSCWCSAYVLAVIHYFVSPLLIAHGFIPVLLSNLLFMVAASYYHYLNFLGYDGKIQH